ncbi:serine hydrolase domain-containing protein [Actinophytocola sp.]|uniref:serine hydrolase domain-containing protein n=1 Tax=Actinophytocola sp. TaxID=1872138 RepID=UPI002ED2B666
MLNEPDGWLPTLRTRLAAESAAGRFSGAVLVARNDTVLFAEAHGMADRTREIPNQLSTRFRLGSINKVFTAVAVCQLIQAGAVDPHEPFGTYLPDFPNRDLAAGATVHHLLVHRAGTGNIFGPEYESRREELRTVDDYVRLFGHRDAEFEPGSRHGYSNFGYVVLGALIEHVTGQSYHDYVDEHIHAAAGMSRSGSAPEAEVGDLAIGYTDEVEGSDVNTGLLSYRGSPAGNGYSTVEDLWRFANALTGHRLLDARHTRLVTTGQDEDGWAGRCVAYGCWEWTAYGLHSFGASGGFPGVSTNVTVHPGDGYVIVVLANMDPDIALYVSNFIHRRLPVTT